MSAEIDSADGKTAPPNGQEAEPVVPSNLPSDVRAEVVAVLPNVRPQPKVQVSDDTIFTGDLLKQIREQQKITLKEISDRTRISVSTLAALEAERFEDLPNARVYVRGFVRCLAAEIGLDKDHVSRTYVPRWEHWFSDQQHR